MNQLDDDDDWDLIFTEQAVQVAQVQERAYSTQQQHHPPPHHHQTPPHSFSEPSQYHHHQQEPPPPPSYSNPVRPISYSPPRELTQRTTTTTNAFAISLSPSPPSSALPPSASRPEVDREKELEIDRLKEELGRVSKQLLHLEQECFELRKEKDKHRKFVSSMTEKKEAATRNSDGTNLSRDIKESGDVLVNHKDSRQFQNALCLSGQPGSRIDIGVSTSKATSVQTDETSASARQIPNDDLSKKLLSIWGSSNDSNEQELGRNVISNLLMDCQTDFLFLFGCIGINRMDKLGDDSSSIAASQYHLHMSHTPEAAKVSHLYSVLTKAKNGMLKLEALFQPLLNLCSLENVIIVQASLHILHVFLRHLVRLERHFERRVNVMVEGLGMKYSYAESQSKNGVWNNGIATWFSNIDWISLFEVILQATMKNTNQGVRLEAVSVMNMIIMRSNAFVERERFGQTLVFEILSQLLAKEAGFEARKQAVQLLYMLLNCPKILVKFCSDYKEGKAALAMDDNVGDASGYQKCSMILQGLADCIACCGNSLEELKLRRIAVLLLAFLASSGASGFEILVSHKLFRDANFLMLILQVLASEVDTEPAVNADQAQIFKERTLLLREALILLNRLVSNPAYSATVLGLLTNSRDMASLTVDVANRLSRKDQICEKFDGMTRQMRESEIVDLARAFKKRVFVYLGDNIQ
ncbi:protein SENSITIVE TO UV 2 isoform X1 [Pyrus x bretschneideri]|uniref:protein SENSITIVE TO UV 2 isoform X1 n=1 Tax=Pyrus x bretschneideri TaxID=225117 RepID=UPI00202DE856|nr:protein SENSITIVE TO UV 2 isoform X1 [Pyrus x bretschneideri]